MSKREKKKRDRRKDFLALVPSEVKRILDVGCGDGGLSAQLKREDRQIIGIEKELRAYRRAKEKLNQVFLADAQDLKLPYPEGYFDCLIYADILDCFVDPLEVLKKHRNYLKQEGFVIASMANIQYYKAIIRLISGSWDYTDGGILWKEHLRFFTLINIRELFQEAGYKIIKIERNIVAARGFRLLNFFLFNKLKNFLTYQYYIKAKKLPGGSALAVRKRKIYQF